MTKPRRTDRSERGIASSNGRILQERSRVKADAEAGHPLAALTVLHADLHDVFQQGGDLLGPWHCDCPWKEVFVAAIERGRVARAMPRT